MGDGPGGEWLGVCACRRLIHAPRHHRPLRSRRVARALCPERPASGRCPRARGQHAPVNGPLVSGAGRTADRRCPRAERAVSLGRRLDKAAFTVPSRSASDPASESRTACLCSRLRAPPSRPRRRASAGGARARPSCKPSECRGLPERSLTGRLFLPILLAPGPQSRSGVAASPQVGHSMPGDGVHPWTKWAPGIIGVPEQREPAFHRALARGQEKP
jgi:hypothetical protein